ncbi:MAG TPA: hypothetical protein PLG21_19540 [Anaerolineae bacterium]|nr:hypothetical protein [Anaerolineae bacterium]
MRDLQIGRVCVLQALAVRDPAVWQFCAAYQRIEAAAFAESRSGGLNCTGSGGGDGIPLGHEQRLSVEIPLLLDRLREILEEATTDPKRALEALDKLGGAW